MLRLASQIPPKSADKATANDGAGMGNVGRTRAGSEVRAGRRRALAVAARLGVALADARRAAGMRQAEVADRSGLSQTRVSELERGVGAGASLETWALAAAAVGEQLVGFLEHAGGSNASARHGAPAPTGFARRPRLARWLGGASRTRRGPGNPAVPVDRCGAHPSRAK